MACTVLAPGDLGSPGDPPNVTYVEVEPVTARATTLGIWWTREERQHGDTKPQGDQSPPNKDL